MQVSEGRRRWLIGFAISLALVLALGFVYDVLRADAAAQLQCTRSSTQQVAAGGSCYPRSAPTRTHVRRYRHGYYGHAGRLRYSHKMKRIIVRKVLARWPERWGAKNRPEAWHRVVRHDSCHVPPNKYVMTCTGKPGAADPSVRCPRTDKTCRAVVRLTICATGAAIAWPVEAVAAGVMAGTGCGFDFVLGRSGY